jgi:hypothetical protein
MVAPLPLQVWFCTIEPREEQSELKKTRRGAALQCGQGGFDLEWWERRKEVLRCSKLLRTLCQGRSDAEHIPTTNFLPLTATPLPYLFTIPQTPSAPHRSPQGHSD